MMKLALERRYVLYTKGYELKLWKVILHYTTLILLMSLFLFYPWWLNKLSVPQLNFSIVCIVHLELFKLLFRPRMLKISFNVYIFCFFSSFFLWGEYSAIGIFMWMFILTMVPLYFVNSRSRKLQIFKDRKGYK